MDLQTSPAVSFVVLNWNQPDMTSDCLASLNNQDYKNFRVIVVDNGSSDESVERLRSHFPWAHILSLPENIGYSRANNIGIEHALGHNPDYIFLLNNDTILDTAMLDRLIKVAEETSDIGLVGPTIFYFDQPDLVWSAGATVDWQTGAVCRLRENVRLSPTDDMPCEDVGFLSSCGVCIKAEIFRKIGLLDERFFIYYEEADWSARAHAIGWRSVYVPQAKLWHRVSATMGTTSPATEYYMNRNVLLFITKHLEGWARVSALARATCRNLAAALAYSVKSDAGRRIPNRNARLLALRDAILGRWGRMGPDVAAICYAERR